MDDCVISPSVVMFQLLQAGLIFTALVAGMVSMTHILLWRFTRCRNSATLAAVMMIGLCHLVSCIYLIQMSASSGSRGLHGCHVEGCLDYYATATIANTLLLVVILHNVIMNCCQTKTNGYVYSVCYAFPVLSGLYMAVNKPQDDSSLVLGNDSIMSLGKQNQTHLDVFLPVCPTSVSGGRFRLMYEYCLIYVPSTIVIFAAWCKTRQASKGGSLLLSCVLCTHDTSR